MKLHRETARAIDSLEVDSAWSPSVRPAFCLSWERTHAGVAEAPATQQNLLAMKSALESRGHCSPLARGYADRCIMPGLPNMARHFLCGPSRRQSFGAIFFDNGGSGSVPAVTRARR